MWRFPPAKQPGIKTALCNGSAASRSPQSPECAAPTSTAQGPLCRSVYPRQSVSALKRTAAFGNREKPNYQDMNINKPRIERCGQGRGCNSDRAVSSDPWVLRLKHSCRPCTARTSLLLDPHQPLPPLPLPPAFPPFGYPFLRSCLPAPGPRDPGRQPGWRALCQLHHGDSRALVCIPACAAPTKATRFHALLPSAAAAAAPSTVALLAALPLCCSGLQSSSVQQGVGVPAWKVQQCCSPWELEASRTCVHEAGCTICPLAQIAGQRSAMAGAVRPSCQLQGQPPRGGASVIPSMFKQQEYAGRATQLWLSQQAKDSYDLFIQLTPLGAPQGKSARGRWQGLEYTTPCGHSATRTVPHLLTRG